MRNRTRLFVTVASATLVVGVATAGVASYVGLDRIGLIGSTSSGDLAYIPGSAQVVGFADVRHVMDSSLRHTLQPTIPSPSQTTPGTANPLEQIGLNPETDIDSVLVAALPGATAADNVPLLIARGRFDAGRIEAAVRNVGGAPADYRGVRTVATDKIAVAFLDTGVILVGQPAAVHTSLDTKLNNAGSVTADESLMRLVHRVDSANTWVVANFEALQTLKQLPGGVATQLPAITWLAASGEIADGVSARIFAEGRDAKAAQDLQEVIKGFVALARMQTGQEATFSELLNSVQLTNDGNTVTLSFALPAQFFEKLKKSAPQLLPGVTPQQPAVSKPAQARPAA
jgi:hypothetical protein